MNSEMVIYIVLAVVLFAFGFVSGFAVCENKNIKTAAKDIVERVK